MGNLVTKLGVSARRAAVAKLITRGFDAAGVADKLTKLGYKTLNNKNISPAVVGQDIKALEEEWVKKSSADIERHKARQYEELQNLKKRAWKTKNFDLVLKILDKEMILLGTKVTASDKESPKYVKNETNQQFNILTDDRRNSEILKILNSGREREVAVINGCKSGVDATSETVESVPVES